MKYLLIITILLTCSCQQKCEEHYITSLGGCGNGWCLVYLENGDFEVIKPPFTIGDTICIKKESK